MANLDFYAVADDLRDLVRFLFAETDVVIYELSSRYDHEARHFRSLTELEAVFTLGSYRSAHLQLWSSAVMQQPVFRRVELTAVPGHSFRYAVEGAGLMQLYLNGTQDGVIHHTHFGHWNEAGARECSMHSSDDCDWRTLRRVSGRIQRHIQGRLAAAKLYARPVLRHAFDAVQNGAGLWWGPEIHRADSADIRLRSS
jgi:hypothetical protein